MPQATFKFILSKPYDFTDNNGQRITGITCQCFDPENKCIIKVKTKHLVNAEFGDDILVNIVFNGRYANYELAE